MAGNKTIKKLMGIGCQRNDAAAFARVYRKLMQTGNQDMFPGIIEPVEPVQIVRQDLEVREIRTTATIPFDQVRFYEQSQEFAERLVEKMTDELAHELGKSGAIKIQHRFPNQRGTGCFGEEYVASIKVVMPGGEV